ncbi:YtzI protein [Mesobacillus maritimus]|uniref:YtzI protein n=1 Tax=Mesobacillus maritimus TaxID=1643336 RepID=UPI00203DB70A|nr:YtzI protein [Mesobacillus maritimus]MCM3587977.1 YtzI protein [Mesobacillus maritimus]MCM3670151.1 YtzI protein [Mesobacillus maritimus]
MLTVLIISIIIVIVVLLLAVLTTSKAYTYKHTVDPIKDDSHHESRDADEKSKNTESTKQ